MPSARETTHPEKVLRTGCLHKLKSLISYLVNRPAPGAPESVAMWSAPKKKVSLSGPNDASPRHPRPPLNDLTTEIIPHVEPGRTSKVDLKISRSSRTSWRRAWVWRGSLSSPQAKRLTMLRSGRPCCASRFIALARCESWLSTRRRAARRPGRMPEESPPGESGG